MSARSSILSRQRAFSLVEVLVAMAVLGMLVVLLGQLLSPAMQMVGNGRRDMEIRTKARAAMDLVSRDISQGVFREDVPAFHDPSGFPAMAFFTRRSGMIDAADSPAAYRNLGLVLYQAKEVGEQFHLYRGSVNLRWDEKSTYPQVDAGSLPGPMPFADNSIAVAYPVASSADNLQPILSGVARMELRFLGVDGRYRDVYDGDTTSPTRSKAAVITLLIIDENSQQMLKDSSTVLTAFRNSFVGPGAQLPNDAISDVSLKSQWEEEFNNAEIWDSIPEKLRKGVYAFEWIQPLF